MKKLSKNWWVPGGLEPGTMSSMFAPRPIIKKAINFWSGLLKFKFQEFFTKKYYNNLHEVHKKNQKKIVIKLSALLIHSCWNCSNKYWGGCYDNRALRIIGLKSPAAPMALTQKNNSLHSKCMRTTLSLKFDNFHRLNGSSHFRATQGSLPNLFLWYK